MHKIKERLLLILRYVQSHGYFKLPLFTVAIVSLGVLSTYTSTNISQIKADRILSFFREDGPIIISSVLAAWAVASGLFSYLEKDRFDDLIKRSERLKDKPRNLKYSEKIRAEDYNNALHELEDYLNVVVSPSSKKNVHAKMLPYEKTFSHSQERIKSEIYSLRRQSILNLVLGISITIIGMILLWIYINEVALFTSNPEYSDGKYLLSFIPRISLVILVEIFAYFFLRLYKNSIDDIKFFQNELTNIESKQIALEYSDANNIVERKIIIKELMRIDRNRKLPIINKNIDTEGLSNFIKSVGDVVKDKD
jgi:hypothetical protein